MVPFGRTSSSNRSWKKDAYVALFFLGFMSIGSLPGQTQTTQSSSEATISIQYPNNTDFYLYKGQRAAPWHFITKDYSDENGDGVTQAVSIARGVTSPEVHWISLQPNFQAETQLVPPQSEFFYFNDRPRHDNLVYADASNLRVGLRYELHVEAWEEVSANRSGVSPAPRYFHIMPYPIDSLKAESPGGSYGEVRLTWATPSAEFWHLKSLAIAKNDTAPISIGTLSMAELVRVGIPASTTSIQISDARRGMQPYYSVVGYDSLGEAVALSSGAKPGYSKSTFSLLAPNDGDVVRTRRPLLDWQDVPGYLFELHYDDNQDFTSPTIVRGIAQSQFQFPDSLIDRRTYYWKVKAYFAQGAFMSNETRWSFNVNSNNLRPTSFHLVLPQQAETLNTLTPEFRWEPATDRGDHVRYRLLVARDALFSSIIIDDTTSNTFFYVNSPLPDDLTYHWKVSAFDESESSPSYEQSWFTLRYDHRPAPFELLFPKWNYDIPLYEIPVETGLFPEFSWRKSIDPDGGQIRYDLSYGTDSTLTTVVRVTGLRDTLYVPSVSLVEDRQYYWRVDAVDSSGNRTRSSGLPYSFVTNSANKNPEPVLLITPPHESVVSPDSVQLQWSEPEDDIYDYILYDLSVSTDSAFSTDTRVFRNLFGFTGFSLYRFPPGTYYWKVIARSRTVSMGDGGSSSSAIRSFAIVLPAAPLLVAPLNEAQDVPRPTGFVWRSVLSATGYHIQVASDSAWVNLVANDSSLIDTSYSSDGTRSGSRYFWRARARNDGGWGMWSQARSLTTSGTLDVEEEGGRAREFVLLQNYPSPFNPITSFEIEMKEASHVSLRVYDVSGREIAILVDEMMPGGKHLVQWDASEFGSGVYVYRLVAGTYIAVGRTVLLR